MDKNFSDYNDKKSHESITDTDIQQDQNRNNKGNPEDLYCECCGRNITELLPFGNPKVIRTFDGASLIKSNKPNKPYNEEAEAAWEKAILHFTENSCIDNCLLQWMITEYGKEKGKYLYSAAKHIVKFLIVGNVAIVLL